MKKQCKLVLQTEVNAKFEGLDPGIRRKLVEATKFFIPYARHTPAFKLGRWDGTVSYTTIGGSTYINLLDRLLPIVEESYDVELVDNREIHDFIFPDVDEDYFTTYKDSCVWPPKHPAAGQLIKLRDYQVDIVNTYLTNLQCIQEISTGAGKCLTYDTELEIDIDITSPFGLYLINKYNYLK